jgi:hypothetical protein
MLNVLFSGFYISISDMVIHMMVICHVTSSTLSNGQSGELLNAPCPPTVTALVPSV